MRIRVPASIANIGPGFDCMAMAIDLWLEVIAEPADKPAWDYEGEGAEYLAAHPNPFSKMKFKGLVKSEIPMGVGLGSSAAARLASSALTEPWDIKSHVIDAGADEGHLDNVAASAAGGIRIVTEQFDERLPNPGWGLAVFVAHAPVATEKARAALPDSVPLDSAVYNAARTALLVRAITAKRPTLLEQALRDRIHQPHRLHLYPWTQDVIDAAERTGAYGAAICGAGPSVFAFCASSQALRRAMRARRSPSSGARARSKWMTSCADGSGPLHPSSATASSP